MATVNSYYTERFRSQFKSWDNKTYYISIYDARFTTSGAPGSPPYSFDITDSGLNLTYDSKNQEKFAPIVGCKCTLNFMIDYDVIGHSQFMNDLLTNPDYQERDIYIVVRTNSVGGPILFYGEYLMDLDTLPDVGSPFPIQLTFTDGIGKLKEIDFELSNTWGSGTGTYSGQGYQPFTYWISQILLHTKHFKNPTIPTGFWDDYLDTEAFQTCVRWYNSEMEYGPQPTPGELNADPLNQTWSKMNWASQYNPANDQLNIASAYDVLEAICKAWGMRVIAWGGKWHFFQIYEYSNTNIQTGNNLAKWTTPKDSQRFRYFAGDSNAFAFSTSMGDTTFSRFNNDIANFTHPGRRIQKLQGGKYKFLPRLKEVKINLVHEGFQNVFGGIPEPDEFGTNGILFVSGSTSGNNEFINSTQYKFKTNLYIQLTAPSGQYLTSYDLTQMGMRIIALPAGSTSVADGLATLTFDPVSNSYGWDDTPPYTGTNLGMVLPIVSVDGPYPGGQVSVIKLGPDLEFPGYRDAATSYMITMGFVRAKNQLGTLINISTGYPYSSAYAFTSWLDPFSNTGIAPPSWSTGFANWFLSTIQPISNNPSTMNTIFVNSNTKDSQRLDWGDIYWGDGPEYWDNSALRVKTGLASYEFTDWTSPDWKRCGVTDSLPTKGSGYNFNELLTYQMKECQSISLKRASLTVVNSPQGKFYGGHPFFVNPMGALTDCYSLSNPVQYFFTRGTYNFITGELNGEWLEATVTDISGGGNSFSTVAGGTNSSLSGNTLSGSLNSGALPNNYPRLTLLRATEQVIKDVAITSLDVQVNRSTDIDAETDFLLGVDYNLKSGDKVWMVYGSGEKYELTLTSDVATDASSISFNSITPTVTSNTAPLIQIPMLNLWENMNRKTSGKIAGLDITATTIDGATHVGRQYISFRVEGYDCATGDYYIFNGEDNTKSGRMASTNPDAPTQISGQRAMKSTRFYCEHAFKVESAKMTISALSSAVVTMKLYKATISPGSSSKLTTTELASGAITGTGNATPYDVTFTIPDVDIAAGDVIIPQVVCTGISSTNFRGILSFTLIRK